MRFLFFFKLDNLNTNNLTTDRHYSLLPLWIVGFAYRIEVI